MGSAIIAREALSFSCKKQKENTFVKLVKYNDLLVGACNTWEHSEGREIFSRERVKLQWFERVLAGASSPFLWLCQGMRIHPSYLSEAAGLCYHKSEANLRDGDEEDLWQGGGSTWRYREQTGLKWDAQTSCEKKRWGTRSLQHGGDGREGAVLIPAGQILLWELGTPIPLAWHGAGGR